MTEDDIVRRGAIAASLFDNPDIMWFFNHYKELTLESIGQTKPEQYDQREQLFYQHRAVDEVLGIMMSYVDAAKAIHEKNERESD
jgi:hypothetical protein